MNIHHLRFPLAPILSSSQSSSLNRLTLSHEQKNLPHKRRINIVDLNLRKLKLYQTAEMKQESIQNMNLNLTNTVKKKPVVKRHKPKESTSQQKYADYPEQDKNNTEPDQHQERQIYYGKLSKLQVNFRKSSSQKMMLDRTQSMQQRQLRERLQVLNIGDASQIKQKSRQKQKTETSSPEKVISKEFYFSQLPQYLTSTRESTYLRASTSSSPGSMRDRRLSKLPNARTNYENNNNYVQIEDQLPSSDQELLQKFHIQSPSMFELFKKKDAFMSRNHFADDDVSANVQNSILKQILSLKRNNVIEQLVQAKKSLDEQDQIRHSRQFGVPNRDTKDPPNEYTYLEVLKLPYHWNDNYYSTQKCVNVENLEKNDFNQNIKQRIKNKNLDLCGRPKNNIEIMDQKIQQIKDTQKIPRMKKQANNKIGYGDMIPNISTKSKEKKKQLNFIPEQQQLGFADPSDQQDIEDYFHYYVQSQKD